MTTSGSSPRNRLLKALPAPVWQEMQSSFERTPLVRGKVVSDRDRRISTIYFPLTGVISSVCVLETGVVVEMATTGCEGMVPVSAILDAKVDLTRQLVQVDGVALVVPHREFCRLEASVPEFRQILRAFGRAYLVQVQQSAACNAVHSVQERAARWLLTSDDRHEGDSLPLTHEFLAEMLGVTRPVVSLAAERLKRAGLIRYARGRITVLDRPGLERQACECYGIVHRAYEQAMANA